MAQAKGSRAALTGVVFIILVLATFFIGGETPAVDASEDEITSYYSDEAKVMTATILSALAAVLLLFFAGVLRSVLAAGEGPGGWLPAVAFGGAVVAATGMLIFAGLSFTLVDGVDTLDPEAAQTLNALNIDLFFPLGGGIVTLLAAAGLSSLRTKALPVWLAWAALVIAVAAFTPIGFFAFLAGLLWILIVSIVLFVRGPGPAGADPAGPAVP